MSNNLRVAFATIVVIGIIMFRTPARAIPKSVTHAVVNIETFETRLDRFVEAHARATKFVKFACTPQGHDCAGWGDRLKATMTAAAFAMFTNRGIVIESTRSYNLRDVYDPNRIDWTIATRPVSREIVSCFSLGCSCVLSRFAALKYSNADEILVDTNYECAGQLSRLFDEPTVFAHANWLGRLYDAMFVPTPTLRALMNTVGTINTGVHIRFGGTITRGNQKIPNTVQNLDAENSLGTRDSVDVAKQFYACFVELSRIYDYTKPVFVAMDSDLAIPEVNATFGGACFGTSFGLVGHIEKRANTHMRAHAEFEILRRSRFLLASGSGFSLMAYRVRVHDSMVVVHAHRTNPACTFPFHVPETSVSND